MVLSSSLAAVAINQACCLWLLHAYERLWMIYNAVIMRKCCHIGVMYQCITTRQHIRLLCYNLLWKFAENLTHWSYSMVSYQIISYNMLCVWAVFTVTWKLYALNRFPVPKFYPYLWVREPLEHSESYILRKPRLLCRNCKNFRSQFATGEWEPSDLWQYVSVYPSLRLNGIPHLEIVGKQEPALQTTEQHVAQG